MTMTVMRAAAISAMLTFSPAFLASINQDVLAADTATAAVPIFHFKGLKAEQVNTDLRQYLVYMQDKDTGEEKMLSIWHRRSVVTKRKGEDVVEVRQVWMSDDKRMKRREYSVNRLSDYAPLYHRTDFPGMGIRRAYEFNGKVITGDQSVEGNQHADYRAEMLEGGLNWELDMETFALLPLAEGRTFGLNFHQPGAQMEAKTSFYKVTGSETLTDFSGNPVDCWTLYTDYGDGNHAIFYLRKSDGELIKMVEHWGNMVRQKIRLGVLADGVTLPAGPDM
ncbi:hypothetical protein [Kordiimonas lacus]|uniref:Outer membrane lipoprotein-sorting protein n=1 Tax=Kordiimonas lacus TaxID=637679 RepID=A0A1G6SVF0_9PROT|nr:hypothetical protein [Kordiimonas lacus]SDD20763.1 hypothetical protein SAMN04488071_0002 [Kordiimonas lacus]